MNKDRNVVHELKEAGIDRVRVSLNAHNKTQYNQICKPIFEDAFENILEFIKKANEVGIVTEVTVVRIPELDLESVKELVEKNGVKLRIREYYPFFW